MIGILAEKPSQARNFAIALGGMQGTFNGEDYTIVPARGHLYGFIDDPSKQVPSSLSEKYASWDIKNLPWNERDFAWKYTTKKDVESALDKIKNTFSKCDEIVIGTDDDPTGEGELLAVEILLQLKIKASKYSRMYFADESAKEVQKAFANRKLLGHRLEDLYNDPDYKQALFRTKWDYLSMQWTRIATAFSPQGQVPRQGRLKSAMVMIVGSQIDARNKYVRKPYYQVRFKDENGIVYTNPDESTFSKPNDVPISNYHNSNVIVESKKMMKTSPPKFLDIASLGSLLAPMGIDAGTVLATYQNMYEANVVSYPRTEDKCITIEQFNALLPLVDNIADLVGIDKSLLTHREPRKSHIKNGMAHGANRPGSVVPDSLESIDEKYGKGAKLIYTTLARNYLATLCEDYEYEQQKGYLEEYPKFKGTTNIPKKMGWKKVFNDTEDNDEDVSSNELGEVAKPYVYEGVNKKPQEPTMKWLMKQLEKYDVGTGATRTSVYADVTRARSKYPLLVEKKGKLSMAPNGLTSYALLPNTHIGSLQLTESVMQQMKAIYEGKTDGNEFLHEIQQMIRDDIATMKSNSTHISGNADEKASAQVTDKYSGIWNGTKVEFKREWSGHVFTADECEKLCSGEMIEIEAVSKDKKKYVCKGRLAEQSFNGHSYIGFKPDFNAPVSKPFTSKKEETNSLGKCPWCGRKIVTKKTKTGKTIFCHEEQCDCEFVLWNEVKIFGKNVVLRESDVKKLLGKGLPMNFTNKEGNGYIADITIEKNSEIYNGKKYAKFKMNFKNKKGKR